MEASDTGLSALSVKREWECSIKVQMGLVVGCVWGIDIEGVGIGG